MFNIGFSELLILGVIAIIVIGPEQLPDMARKLARMLNELKRAKDEIMRPMEDFKDETLRTVDRVRLEAEKVREKVDTDLKNKVTEILNQNSNKSGTDKINVDKTKGGDDKLVSPGEDDNKAKGDDSGTLS